jgi:AcrR family transcriptional regulator
MARPRSDIEPRIVHAARKRFLADGVDGASLRRIGRDAGTSIGMIYYYFPTKDDLFLAVVEEIYGKVLAEWEDMLSAGGSFDERIRGVYQRIGSMSDEELEVFRLVVREALVSSSRLDRLVERFKRGHIALMLQAVLSGLSDGELDQSIHPAVLVMSTFALGVAPQIIRRVAAERLDWIGLPRGEAFAEQLVRVLLGGIGAKSAEPPPDSEPNLENGS